MVDNQHKKIKGYRDLTVEEIEMINVIKGYEGNLKALLNEALPDDAPGDSKRWMAIAKTNLETGFMFAVKAIARPSGQMGSDD